MNQLGNEENYILCDQVVKGGDQLNDIGWLWSLKDEEDKDKKHAMVSIIDQAKIYTWKNL